MDYGLVLGVALLHLVKEFIVAVWEVRKQKLYGDAQVNVSVGPQLEIGVLLLELVGKSGKSGISHGKGEGVVVINFRHVIITLMTIYSI